MARDPIVFLHAHPDDEAIFTGGVMRLLADDGWTVILVCATSGEAGAPTESSDLGAERRAETRRSADLLGVADVHFLGYSDSGIDGERADGFAHANIDEASARLISLMPSSVEALVIYDDDGTYGHPDHIQVHRVGMAVADALGIERVYEATVDREHLHFVETHLVVEAGLGERPESLGLAATTLGRPTVLIDTIVDVTSVLEVKRAAMAAHRSQLASDAPVFDLGVENFAAVYGNEWFVRRGPRGALEQLS